MKAAPTKVRPKSIKPTRPARKASHQARRAARSGDGGAARPTGRRVLEALQLSKLQRLLRVLRPANAFYRTKLEAGGVKFEVQSLSDFTRRFPLTTKQELVADQKQHPPYGSNLSFPARTYVRCHQTSGSTGEALRWLDTPESWQHLVRNWREIFDAAGVTPEDRFLFAFSFGPFIGFWSALESAQQRGCFCFTAGTMSSQARLHAIADHGVTVLACTPTYALHLGEVARTEKMQRASSSVRLIIVAGEPGGSIPATRTRLMELWPAARVFDHYGMTETGPATYECPAGPGVLHVIESAYLPEVIQPTTGAAVKPGEVGELVLTTLDRIGSPLLRYRTGDLVKPRAQRRCACGRLETALVGGILGRSDDMVIVRGVNVFPGAVEEIVRRTGEVVEYRALLDHRGPMVELSLEIEPTGWCPDPKALKQRIENAFQDALALRVPVKLVSAGTLPRFEMKSKRWIKLNR